MLNELLIVERGARRAGIEMTLKHPNIRDAGKIPTLHVFLNEDGRLVDLRVIPMERIEQTPLWKLSKGQHNSFPFVKPKSFWTARSISAYKKLLGRRPSISERRDSLLTVGKSSELRRTGLGAWTKKGMVNALRELQDSCDALRGSDAAALPNAVDRFISVIESENDGSATLVEQIADRLLAELAESTLADLIEVATRLFTESGEKGGALFIDAAGDFPFDLADLRVLAPLCERLREFDIEQNKRVGRCAITGADGVLVTDNFSQPNLPKIQQSWLFARNDQSPSFERYGKTASSSCLVGYDTDIRLRAAIEALTAHELCGKSWRGIPQETGTNSDLLVAFVDKAIDAPVASCMSDDGDFDEADEELQVAQSVAAFEKRTGRVVEAVRGLRPVDFRDTPVQVAVWRSLDKANRKVIYSGTPTVASLYDAATLWANGERNVPRWTELPVLRKGERKPRSMSSPHVAPLGMIAFSRSLFVRGGEDRQEVTGIPASEALALFLEPVTRIGCAAGLRAVRLLRMVLTRRGCLVCGTAHALRKDLGTLNQGSKFWTLFDRREALRTMSVLGVLLLKLNRSKEVYMADAAFRLGQLLAGLDVVHAGYCADVRGGDVPPSMLGNQVFTMAQKSPVKALAMIARRWKPYEGWAGKAVRDRDRIDGLVASKKETEKRRGWEIRKALRHAREIRGLADKLATELRECRTDDVFRAELLLGYVAGFPAAEKSDSDKSSTSEA
ncbi:MAG: hypothetical protein Fues2KO_53310 [Fuerstiella sp.]